MKQPTLCLKIAEEKDKEDILMLSRELYEASVYHTLSPFSDEDVRTLFLNSLEMPKTEFSTVLLKEDGKTVGFIAFGAGPQSFSKQKMAIEVAFWVREGHKTVQAVRMLLEAYYYWARLTGCVAAFVGRFKDNRSVEVYKLKRLV